MTKAIAKIVDEEKSVEVTREKLAFENSLLMSAPKLKSLTIREVLAQASEQQIQIKFVGSGRVESTWPAEGEALNADRNMTVFLKE